MGRLNPIWQAGTDDLQLTGAKRTILVTGCSSGIGAYCAQALKSEGWRVFATARKPDDIDRLKSLGFEVYFLDYRDPVSIKRLVDNVLNATGGTLDALFNNGGYAQPGAVEDVPMDALREQFETNVFGWHDLTRRIVPVMRAQGHGRIVFNSSILGLVPQKWRGAYNASKHAIEGLMLTMRMELDGSGIRVSMINPGAIESKIAVNAAAMADKYIDMENSPHKAAYDKRLALLRSGGASKAAGKLGPEAVYTALRHALLSNRPRPHYVITAPARLAVALKRLLPASVLYSLMSRWS
jgi:NAD(P)-dependent dehydrogenase (short-subunit alcohol dehydrogenase family)